MRKEILESMISLAIIMIVIVNNIGTLSYFSDIEVSEGNTFTAGTLDLKVDGIDNPGIYFNVSNIAPGSRGFKSIILSNTGSLTGKVYIHFKNVRDSPGTTPDEEPTPDNGELSENLYIKVIVDNSVRVEGYLSNIACTRYLLGNIAGGGSLTVIIEWEIPGTVGNEIMDDSVAFDIEFILEQA